MHGSSTSYSGMGPLSGPALPIPTYPKSGIVDGESSIESPVISLPVTSGAPQGSALGPLLFLIYIKDFYDYVQSNVRLFADDTILYHFVQTTRTRKDYKRI